MKSDSSRNTFDPRKHFSSVRMQQGRVQLDADWNEQHDIGAHRIRAEAADVIGACGGPLHHAAFHIVGDVSQLSADETALPENTPANGFVLQAGDFLISAGHYYVGGILCENDRIASYLTQPDLPGATAMTAAGLYIVYLDVWERHLTALDDPSIREIALGGPDTATRTKTIWQVKYKFAGTAATGNCQTTFPDFEALIAPGDGTLSARAQPGQASTSPCIVPSDARYRGLENQLYRVEVHDGGPALDATTSGTPVTRVANTDSQVQFTGSPAVWTVGQAVEIFSSSVGSDPMNGTLAYITSKDDGAKRLTLNINVSALTLDEPRLRIAAATYKWSRNNGAIVTTIESMNGKDVTVHDLGPDAVLGFTEGQWVEIADDGLELNGRPGQLTQISSIDRAVNVITLSVAPRPLSAQAGGVDKTLHPKLRAWDGVGAIKFHPKTTEDHFLDLEDGVQVRFFAGSFKSGDYWNIPARTATADTPAGNIDWPDDSGKPLAQRPFGIKHRYCRLAMLQSNGKNFASPIEDCRHLFPPITELTSLFYVSGDGQEAMPGDPLPQLLQAGVFNGEWPVPGARVRFIAEGAGRLAPTIAGLAASTTNTIEVSTGVDGVASCAWKLEGDVTKPSQHVTARLLNANGDPLPPIVGFNGNLSIAAEVFYDPGSCASMVGRGPVQQAIEQLSDLVSLYELSGGNQEVMPGAVLEPLRVLAANRCGPVGNQHISFKVTAGTGTIVPADAVTASDGTATATWTLDPTTLVQHVDVALVDGSPISVAAPTILRFTANLSLASQVSYTPTAACLGLLAADVKTVQEALDTLCKQSAGADPGIVIKDVTAEADGKPLVNDTLVPVSRLHSGIRIVCDAALDPRSFGPSPAPPSGFPDAVTEKPTCFVTLDLPYPIGSDRTFWDFNDTVGFERIVIACTTVVKDNELLWRPTAAADRWLQTILFSRLVVGKVADRVLARLTLKGNFIFGAKDTDNLVYLDGEAFGIRGANGRTSLRLQSGNGRKGGDFESWFWLIPADGGFVLDAVVIQSSIQGSIKDSSGLVIPGVQVTATQPAKTFTAVTDTSGKFVFIGLTPAIYQVSAQVGGAVLQKTLTVI